MSHIWTFSPSSEYLLDKCIKAARAPDSNNKWIARFGCQISNTNFNNTLTEPKLPRISKEDPPDKSPVNHEENDNKIELNTETFQEFLEVIEQDPILKIDKIIEECTKKVNLLIYLANKLSVTSIEKICKHIFDNKNIDSTFMNVFHQYFIPNLLKREHNWLSLDILVRSHKFYPEAFKLLLFCILKDLSIRNNILQDFVATLDEEETTNILLMITELELSSEEFAHNLLIIFTAYKDAKKSDKVQILILAKILQYGQYCQGDKQFGRLLLSFLQAQKELKYPLELGSMERVIESHKSPFRRPCLNVYNELLESVALDTTETH